MTSSNDPRSLAPAPGTFLPLALLSTSLLIVLTWNVYTGAREHYAALRTRDQLEQAGQQALQAEEKIKALFVDLLALAPTDPHAREVVQKYNVRFTPPAGTAAAAPATAPAAKPDAPDAPAAPTAADKPATAQPPAGPAARGAPIAPDGAS